jgi:hypothetical protein
LRSSEGALKTAEIPDTETAKKMLEEAKDKLTGLNKRQMDLTAENGQISSDISLLEAERAKLDA